MHLWLHIDISLLTFSHVVWINEKTFAPILFQKNEILFRLIVNKIRKKKIELFIKWFSILRLLRSILYNINSFTIFKFSYKCNFPRFWNVSLRFIYKIHLKFIQTLSPTRRKKFLSLIKLFVIKFKIEIQVITITIFRNVQKNSTQDH